MPNARTDRPNSRPARAKIGRRLLQSVALATVTLVLLELTLQVGAFVVWIAQRRPPPTIGSGSPVVLCVGDSWTHGMGASDPARFSYPALLQDSVHALRSGDWTVVNGGQSGQNSRDVLQRLPSQLEQFKPKLVCVLVGQNDFWSVPDELPQDQEPTLDATSYRFRWRIPRLIAWVSGRIQGGAAAGEARPAMSGPEWTPRVVESTDTYQDEPRKWRTPASARANQDLGWERARSNDVAGAIEAFERAATEAPDDPVPHQKLAEFYRMQDRRKDMESELGILRQSFDRDHDYWTGRCLVFALDSCGWSEQARDLSTELLVRYPQDALLWRYRAQSEFFLGEQAPALHSIDESLRLAPDPWAYLIRYKIHALGLNDYDEAIRSMFAGYVALNDAKFMIDRLRGNPVNRPRLRPVLDSFECPPDVHARLARIVEEIVSEDGSAARKVLTAHLTRIVALVRSHGATPVFLDYPIRMPAEDVLRELAVDLEIAFIDVRERFNQLLGGRRWDDVRAPDGHCNDDGYRLMTQAVTEKLIPLLEK